MLEQGKSYTGAELAKALGVSYSTFRNSKKKYLDALGLCSKYEVKKQGRNYIYTIIELYDQQTPLTKTQQTKKLIEKEIMEILSQEGQEHQTPTNLTRLLKPKIGMSKNTLYNQSKAILEEGFKTKSGEVPYGPKGYVGAHNWVMLRQGQQYPLSEEQYKVLLEGFKKGNQQAEEDLEIVERASEDENLTQEERILLAMKYLDNAVARLRFLKSSLCALWGCDWILKADEFDLYEINGHKTWKDVAAPWEEFPG